LLKYLLFQSTRPRGARLTEEANIITGQLFQSTRPRGARQRIDSIRSPESLFQSTRPRGARRVPVNHRYGVKKFQSTRPRGARQPAAGRSQTQCCFNPRARAGRDVKYRCAHHQYRVSIHAPARGATILARRRLRHPYVSIHAPARGATNQDWYYNILVVFQSTRPRGARLTRLAIYFRSTSFNPRARAGRDESAFKQLGLLDVSIHAPARGATACGVSEGDFDIVSIHAPARGATRSE